MVTELVPGSNLKKMLKSKRAFGKESKYKNIICELNDRELVNIALQVATGMQHLERKKVNVGSMVFFAPDLREELPKELFNIVLQILTENWCRY